MKQIFQKISSGEIILEEIPVPRCDGKRLLIGTKVSVISAGTERMLVDFGRAGYLNKARKQPEKARMVLEKAKTDGVMATFDAVRSGLTQTITLGYSNVGVVTADGGQIRKDAELKIGDRVVSNGPHAEVVRVPINLCAKIPDKVSDESACFTVIGAIGLQSLRLAQPTLGEAFVVTGLGLIGLMTVQLLLAHGCRVLGIDFDSRKVEIARNFGAETVDLSKGEDPLEAAQAFSHGSGIDGVIITASTKSNKPVSQAARMCRKRGRIVLVGVTALELNRADFYEKELSFQVSCSYGPGRYDPEYEEKGQDYPIGYVRWTAQRNFEAVLDLMASGKLDVKPLITHRFPFEEAPRAYELISENKESYIGIILEYGQRGLEITPDVEGKLEKSVKLKYLEAPLAEPRQPVVGLIGAGNFTSRMLLPALKETDARLRSIVSSRGISGTHLGRKFGFEISSSDPDEIFQDQSINTVFITTRHDSHAAYVLSALRAGKHVFVEKPLCLTMDDLKAIQKSYRQTDKSKQLLMVGFNRRFAPHVVKIKELLESIREPKSFIMTVNAGDIAEEHWTQDPEIGGGRIIGEACHFVDLLRYLAGNFITQTHAAKLRSRTGDTATLELAFLDGSIGTVHYFANGNRRFPKERLEVFCGGKILQLDNFKILRGYGWNGFRRMRLWRQDKGHQAEVKGFLDAVRSGGSNPIPFDESVEVTRNTIKLAQE